MHLLKLCLFLTVLATAGAARADDPNLAKLTVTSQSWRMPEDFSSALVGDARNLQGLQHDFDVYSWRQFIALNWPADPQGNPRVNRMIGEDGANYTTVWETWRSVPSIFRPDGSTPAPWGKPGESLIAFEEPLDTGPLIDRDGRYVSFDILLNQEMFEFIVQRNLYSTEGQNAYKAHYGNIVFPCGHRADPPGNAARSAAVGSVLIKAAWKELTPQEVASGRFFMRKTSASSSKSKESSASKGIDSMLGLVGLHIVHKSEDVPEWNWATFEQIDNVPTEGEMLGHSHGEIPGNTEGETPEHRKFNFFLSAQGGLPANSPPALPWYPEKTEPADRRSRIVRIQPLSDEVRELNSEAHQQLLQVSRSSVWQYYQLISTQWPTRPARLKVGDSGTPATDAHQACDVLAISPTDVLGGPAPVYLGNSTLESYLQKQVPNVSSSCMECHGNATAQSGEFSDFTYILSRANSQGKH